MADVFISFSFKDQSIVEDIYNKLSNNHNLTCWMCTHEVRGGEHYKWVIRNAIAECKVFVLVQSVNSLLSKDVTNEEGLAQTYKKPVIPFIIEASSLELNGDLHYDLNNTHCIDATKPTLDERIAELADMIKSSISEKISKNTVERTIPLLSTPISSVTNFIGREQELKEIEYVLKRPFGKVALVGIGGIGKSELAKKYAELHADEYSAVLWIPFEKSLLDTFVNDSYVFINGMRRSDYPEDSDREYFNKKLLKLRELSVSRCILLIIDNFNISDDPDLELLCRGEFSVIFTTKNLGFSKNITYIEISEIGDPQKLIELFGSEYRRSLAENDVLAVKKLIDLYRGHTLSIQLIAGVARSRRISPSEMYDILLKHSLGDEKTDKEKKTSNAVFEEIKHVFSMAELSDDEKTLLCVLALVPSCGITVELLHELCGIEDYEVTDGLIMKNWVIHNAYTDEVFLHPIVAEIALNMAHEHQEACQLFFESLLDMTEIDVVNDDYKKKQLNLKLINSVDTRIDYSWQMKRKIRYRHAKVLYDNAQYEQGGEIFRELLKTETDIALILHCYEKIAQTHILTGEYEAGCEIAERGWEYTKTIPTDKIDALVGRYYVGLLHRLIESYRGVGNYEKSLFYGKQCLENCIDFYNTYRGDSNAWTRYHIGRTLLMKGDYAESEAILLCASEFFEKSEDKNGYASCCALLGLICAKKDEKDFDKAISYIIEAKKIRLSINGDSSIDYIELIKLEGDICREMGDMQKARDLYLDALELYKKTNHKTLEKAIENLIASIDQKS